MAFGEMRRPGSSEFNPLDRKPPSSGQLSHCDVTRGIGGDSGIGCAPILFVTAESNVFVNHQDGTGRVTDNFLSVTNLEKILQN